MTGERDQLCEQRIAKAIDGLKPESYAHVLAADVVAVCKSIPEERHTLHTGELMLGAQNATHIAPDIMVWQEAGKLAELLELAGA